MFDYLNLGGHNFPMMGLSDEAQGAMSGIGAMMRGEDYLPAYAEGRDRQREYLDAARERTGWGGTAAEVGASLLPVGMAARGAVRTAQAAPPLARMLKGAAAGAATGAGIGFAEGEGGARRRAENAVLPTAFGGTLGAAGPVVGAGIGRMAERSTRAKAARRGKVPPDTVDVLKHVFEMDHRQGAPVRDASMVADTGGTATSLLGEAMGDIGGRIDDVANVSRGAFKRPIGVPSEATIRQRLTERTARETDEFKKGLDRTMGMPAGLRATEARLLDESRPRVSAAYDRAYNTPIDYASEEGIRLEALLKGRRIPAAAWRKANEILDLEEKQSKQILARIGDDGTVTLERLPDIEQIDAIKRAMDDLIESEKDIKGRLSNKGRILYRTSRDMLKLTDTLVPDYGRAREFAAVPRQSIEAMETGYDAIAKEGTTADQLAADMRNMTPEQVDWLRSGARSAVEEFMQKTKETLVPNPTRTGYVSVKSIGDADVQTALKALTSGRAREKLRLILGAEDAEELFESVDQTMTAIKVEASSLPNRRRQARGLLDEFAPERRSDVASKALRGDLVGAAQESVGQAMGRALADDMILADRTKADIVNVLTSPTDRIDIDALRKSKFPKVARRDARKA
ncbi:MAG: hypothetical protein F4213_22215, partial [Boseongicola sp. SB0677_bin_26]|nr:hypothetical protein [Boseongicola sp. SB0677_bin_26]